MLPQIIVLALVLIELMIGAYAHNKPKSGSHNVWNMVWGIVIESSLLAWGGFFSVIDYPQIIYIGLRIILLLLASNLHEHPKRGNSNFWFPFVSQLITLSLLYWAGFFNHLIK